MAALATHVAVRDDEGVTHSFGPGDEVPEWAARRLTNPKVWEDGEVPFPPAPVGDDSDVGRLKAEVERLTAENHRLTEELEQVTSTKSDDGPPPVSGRGSGEDKWRAYADRKGVDVSDLADRGDIIERLREKGVPVE
ncbi:hypothetical protein [Mycolicibacterium goodii]|uniref:hypothetical protein n=1 Tax=Mycolicibacterium goodii TaxID=134601 RepID=UPI001BDC0C59|nr:hypothetical protein [Mycolicibacterium goodii]MBU8830835.1 hypothetical protein [Mycolicibacterium goodii]